MATDPSTALSTAAPAPAPKPTPWGEAEVAVEAFKVSGWTAVVAMIVANLIGVFLHL